MIIKNAIFDMDGTLVDTMPLWRKIQMDIIEEMYDVSISPPKRAGFVYLTYDELLAEVSKLYSIDIVRKSVTEEGFKRMKEIYLHGDISFKPYTFEYLEHLKNSGCGIALATATTKEIVYPFLERIGILKYFKHIYTTPDDAKIGKLKSSRVYDMALAALGATKENTAVFEDVLAYIKTCKNNGYYTVAVADSLQGNDIDAIKSTADRYINSYKEMI